MMMPEQNEKVAERDEQAATASEQGRTEHGRTEQAMPEQRAAFGHMPSEQTPSEQTPSEQMPSGPQAGHREDEQRERLVPPDHAASYGSRWDAVKGTFVDEPREAVAQADALVGELLEELETLFREQRRSIERGLDTDETSTEDLRMALRRYRSFFERLLAV
jgi:hypothetical protein